MTRLIGQSGLLGRHRPLHASGEGTASACADADVAYPISFPNMPWPPSCPELLRIYTRSDQPDRRNVAEQAIQ